MHKKKHLFLLLLTISIALFQRIQAQNPCTLDVQINPPSAVLTCQNPTIQLTATVTPPGGNLEWFWSGGGASQNTPSITVSQPGSYAVFVFDSLANCWGGDTIVVTSDVSFPQVSITASNIDCNVQNNPVTLSAIVGGGSGNFSYSWTGGQTGPEIAVTLPGTYCVTVTDLTLGCEATQCFALTLPAPLSASVFYVNTFFCGDSTVVCANVSGGVPPYSYMWNNQNNSSCEFDPLPGTYVITITDAFGCSVVVSQVVEDGLDECARLTGSVVADWNTNCTIDPSDDEFAGVIIRVENGAGDEFFANTDIDGEFDVELYPGTYTVTVLSPNALWAACQSSFSLNILANQTVNQDFLLQPQAVCPAMTVDIGNAFLRRCFAGHYFVQYCNEGTAAATDAFIDIQFDPFLTITSAQLPFTNLGNNQYRFQLGTVPFNTCGQFWVHVQVSCNATLGQTHCTEAIVHPTGNCEPANSQWSGASLEVGADCQGDSLEFIIQNLGTGDMTQALEYVIIEDAVMLMQAPPPSIILDQLESHRFKVPANGSTWRVEVTQAPFHPGNSMPSLAVEGCTTNAQFSTGFVNQFPVNDNDPWIDIDCTQNVGAYDPNDKQGFPTGYQSAHYINRGTDLEYLIRFQNTGTDTAFTVVIRDELSPWLDPGSITPGASSHSYRFEYFGDRDIKFIFDNINLPDSSKSQENSQGFVSFRIAQKGDVPLQTDILNQAGIFFDFNEPVYTNTTRHRVGQDFVVVSAWQPFLAGLSLRVMPNPVTETAILQLDGLNTATDWTAELSDATGRPVRTAQVNGLQWRFEREQLPAGIYFLRVISGGQVLGTGKVMLK
jgi:hypothetical protein